MTVLRLVAGTEVGKAPEPSTFEEAWQARKGAMRKRGDGREKTRKLWDKAAKTVGHVSLLDALKRYLREEKEPQCGYPGLSVWLNGERWDHWLPDTSPDGSSPPPNNAAPEPSRSQLVASLGEPFVRSYLDPCTFHEDGYITPATGYAKDKLVEAGAILKACGVVGIRVK